MTGGLPPWTSFGHVIQIGFVVEDMHRAIREWAETLRIGPWFVREHVVLGSQFYRGRRTGIELSIAMGYSGQMMFELIQQHGDEPSVYQEIVRARGYGFHHYGIGTKQYEEAVQTYRDLGYAAAFEAVPSLGGGVVYFDTARQLSAMTEFIKMTPALSAAFAAMQRASVGWDGRDPVRQRPREP